VTQNFPSWRVAKEFRDVDENSVEKLVDFVMMLTDVLAVGGVRVDIELKHAATEPPLKGGLFVSPKVEVSLLGEFLQKIF
jgi:hypothetical protein